MPPPASDALARYRRDSDLRQRIHAKAGEYVRPEALESHARALDLWAAGQVAAPNERSMDLLVDLCLYVEAAGQARGIDLYAAECRPPGGADGARLLAALREARFGLFRYVEPDPRGGATLIEMGNPERVWLMDETLPVRLPPGTPFFARLAPAADYLVTTGWVIVAEKPLIDRARGPGGSRQMQADAFCIGLFRAFLDLGGRQVPPDSP